MASGLRDWMRAFASVDDIQGYLRDMTVNPDQVKAKLLIHKRRELDVHVNVSDMLVRCVDSMTRYLRTAPVSAQGHDKQWVESLVSHVLAQFMSATFEERSASSCPDESSSLISTEDDLSTIGGDELVEEEPHLKQEKDHQQSLEDHLGRGFSEETYHHVENDVHPGVPLGRSQHSIRHRKRLRKDLPPDVIYSAIGVRCTKCLRVFKGGKCVAALIAHTKMEHKSIATCKFLRNLVQWNAPEKVIGEGILYCSCRRCRTISTAFVESNL